LSIANGSGVFLGQLAWRQAVFIGFRCQVSGVSAKAPLAADDTCQFSKSIDKK
jgi:hypothetical protein